MNDANEAVKVAPLTITETIAELQRALSDYIEATYHVSDLGMVQQRQLLLNTEGVIYRKPYIESTPRYQTAESFDKIEGLPANVAEFFTRLATPEGDKKALLFNPPYTHQGQSIHDTLVDGKSLIVMTGTGSGKTESFLMPVLGKIATEAATRPSVFEKQSAVRALILYPMNALVNDQLGRLRLLFGDPRVSGQFISWARRPLRFARYTSRTLYPGVRTSEKDSRRLKPIDKYYVHHLEEALDAASGESSRHLVAELKKRGKWPSKPDIVRWYGTGQWMNSKTGLFKRAVTLPGDSELWTRDEVHQAPPDVLVTNYSMLEYMLMRPLERSIFDDTRAWLEANPAERLLLVLDEAHLYRGAGGSEVALLIRRFTERLGIPPGRLQVICTTASFDNHSEAPKFAAELTGKNREDFVPITGKLKLREGALTGTDKDASLLASVDLEKFYSTDISARAIEARKVSDYLSSPFDAIDIEGSLYTALGTFPPMAQLVNETMHIARPVDSLGSLLFPDVNDLLRNRAVTALLALGSAAKRNSDEPGLLPCRIHSFFRGLPGLWVCMDETCSVRPSTETSSAGKLYSQPRDICECGARVLELYTCRQCGTMYARAYTNDLENPTYLWSEPGQMLKTASGTSLPMHALDLLLEEPTDHGAIEVAEYDLVTGQLNPEGKCDRSRNVYLKAKRIEEFKDGVTKSSKRKSTESLGAFRPCAVCNHPGSYGNSSVQDHQTKGDEPFQALVSRQIQIQPPGLMKATELAPLRGRKVLIFSDSRQMAARLAPNLQKYSTQDALRPLICEGFRYLQGFPDLASLLSLDDLYLAVLLSAKRLGVRLRPELKQSERFGEEQLVSRYVEQFPQGDSTRLMQLKTRMASAAPPESLFFAMLSAFNHRYYGLEAFALASLVEQDARTEDILALPIIKGFVESNEQKLKMGRLWIRQWQQAGFWLGRMPQGWSLEQIECKSGLFSTQMPKSLPDKTARLFFEKNWVPRLRQVFCETVSESEKKYRLKGNELTLLVGGDWAYCTTCRTTQRPPLFGDLCANCGRPTALIIDVETDAVFRARKGYYRASTLGALASPQVPPFSLIAAEHTAQIGSAQADDVFSKAEENELLFQDVDLGVDDSGHVRPAIDVLSCTTTMEVGIDIGALSGVSLRNLPPSRANYQQRAGRAGRRGNAVATVTAFGSADSHDEHFFSDPEGMITGRVDDPKLTLDNDEIIKRHVFAFLIQRYHQGRIPQYDPSLPANLFAVLGTVAEFLNPTSLINRNDFASWLESNQAHLRQQIESWIPRQFAGPARELLLNEFVKGTIDALDKALQFGPNEGGASKIRPDDDSGEEQDPEGIHPTSSNLLERLLYKGVLPRYAFPTDVASFYVFDKDKYTPYKAAFKFSPSQGLPVALSQYAPGKEVWISGKQYRSGAIYSQVKDERFDAWINRELYFECSECGFARKIRLADGENREKRDCPACKTAQTFGEARFWLRPPGFAHPIGDGEETSPDDQPARSYATRAKLSAGTPPENAAWHTVNSRVKMFHLKDHLLVTNRGPDELGYDYCTICGLIEPASASDSRVLRSHKKPFPDSKEQTCKSDRVAKGIVLGTDFITDVLLISLQVEEPVDLTATFFATSIALRTVCEALTKASCDLLELEPTEMLAEFRPAVSALGAQGAQMELYLYDTLAGGAGFCKQVAGLGAAVFDKALEILESCPEHCDRSCYRCLRSFKNKFDHEYLDRHVGATLLRYLITGERPVWNPERLEESREILFQDLRRQNHPTARIVRNVEVRLADGLAVIAPILVERADGLKAVVDVSGALTPKLPADPTLSEYIDFSFIPIYAVEELRVRRNLPSATSQLWERLGL
jgi:ATP-dependent helicase YprA (DUF1998 family)